MKTYILSDQMVRKLLASPELPAAIPELLPYVQQRHINQVVPRRKCGCGGKTAGELKVLGSVKEAILRLPADKVAVAKRLMGADGGLRIYYSAGKHIKNVTV